MLSRRKAAPTPDEPSAADATADTEPSVASLPDPAEELRRTLAANRPAGTVDATSNAGAVETLEERRARVHARAREAIDAMSDEEGDE